MRRLRIDRVNLELALELSGEEAAAYLDFIETLGDAPLGELLEVAIHGAGAFRRFRDVLRRYPAAQDDWFKFRDERERERLLDWLASEDIEPEFVQAESDEDSA
jgi:hypothetical protein